ncbi:GATA transcription factor 20-like isoform X2 [Tasmannia lanceolata]
MHRCTINSQGPCSCGLRQAPASSLSILFAMPNNNSNLAPPEQSEAITHLGPLSSFVDCTLSLGTPSTRQTDDQLSAMHRHPSSSCMTNLLQVKQQQHSPLGSQKCGRGGGNCNTSMLNKDLGEALLARRCTNCDTTSTPLWRNGPRGPKSLCNACGIRYKKEERRARTATGTSICMMEHPQNEPWTYTGARTQKAATSINSFIF